MQVPFNKPLTLDACTAALSEAVTNGKLSGDGPFTRRCQQSLAAQLGAPALLTTSATHALEMMALLLDLKPGDEVILPSYTFVSTANAFALRGARLVFADNDASGNILPAHVEALFTPRTRAVVAMHYAGNSADMDVLLQLCAKHGALLLEDAAQAVGGRFRGRPLGAIGNLGCLSFHDTKNLTMGEGGALILGDTGRLHRAEVLREKGTNRAAFLQGHVDKYTWVDLGSSYVPADLCAAYLWPQLAQMDAINARRGAHVARYDAELCAVWERVGAQRLPVPAHNAPNHHMYAVVMASQEQRTGFMAAMQKSGVSAPFHYVSLHTSPFGRRMVDGEPPALPGCDRLSSRLVRLPLFFNMTDVELAQVVDAVKTWAS
jgi:dTDP-4-amino-4,6-dideoxygalactose transaminase